MTELACAPVCLALALVAAPAPIAVRRRDAVFGRAVTGVRVSRRAVLAAGCVLGAVVTFAIGVGTALSAAVVGATVAVRWRRARRERDATVERARLLEALESVIGELRVGAHPSAAAEAAAGEAEGIAAQAFAIAAARSRLGGAGADGLLRPEAVVAAELARVADAWRVAEHHGLALAELLSAARTDLLGRIRFRARTGAALAGARATATVLAGLPLLGIGLGQLMGAAPLAVLFGSGVGGVLLPLGSVLVCAGLLWTDAITGRVMA